MRKAFENPFAGYGRIVSGNHFIGRNEIISNIDSRIIHSNNPGNLAIIGMHRIGKSSLVYKTIIEQKDKLISKGTFPIWIGLSSYDQVSRFFRSLVTKCVREMKKLNWISGEIQSLADHVKEADDPWDDIKEFFIEVQKTGYSALFILDEFDQARHLFQGETAFQRLRELADYPDYGLSLVLTSRRSIRDIEHAAGSNSPFHNIFQVQRLGMFSDEDLETYFSLFSSLGISISSASRERVLFYCGAHPYLLEMLGCEIVERYRQSSEIDVDKASEAISQSIFEHYDDMIRLLQEEKTLNKLLQILLGPVIDVKPTDVTELQNYGLIKLTEKNHGDEKHPEKGTYVAYSEHFHDYLKLHERSTEFTDDVWPIWRETEKVLRGVITTTMFQAYGDNWIKELEKGRSNLKKIFDECREAQQKEEKSFGDRASQNLIDFTYPADLFTIIFAKGLWQPYFQPIFGHNPNYWEQRKQLLTKCRNPLAHNRGEILKPHERKTLEAYCDEILGVLSDYIE
jgi:hypothetical protein